MSLRGPSANVIVPFDARPCRRRGRCRGATPIRLRSRWTVASIIDDVAGMDRAPVAHALDAHEVDQLLAVLRLRQDQDRADLCDRFGQDRRRQHRRLARHVGQVALVQGDVLDPDDALVRLELGDAIDEQERIAMRQDPFDGGVVERQRDVHEVAATPRPRGRGRICKYNPFSAAAARPRRRGRHASVSHGNPTDHKAASPEAAERELVTTLFDLGRQVTAVLDFDDLLRADSAADRPPDLVRGVRGLPARRAPRRAARRLHRSAIRSATRRSA